MSKVEHYPNHPAILTKFNRIIEGSLYRYADTGGQSYSVQCLEILGEQSLRQKPAIHLKLKVFEGKIEGHVFEPWAPIECERPTWTLTSYL